MVKIPNRPITPMEPQSGNARPLSDECPSLTVEIELLAGTDLEIGDHVSAQIRDRQVRIICDGQLVARVEEVGAAQAIERCVATGGRYEGQVIDVAAGKSVIELVNSV